MRLVLLVVTAALLVAGCGDSGSLPQQGLGDPKPGDQQGAPGEGAEGGQGGGGDEGGFGAADDEEGFGDGGEEDGLGTAGAGEGSFLGVWRGTQDTQFGRVQVETIFQQDGTFQQQTAGAGTLITIWGSFDVYEDQTLLRLNLEGWEPKEWCGPLGCTQLQYPTGESHLYRFADEDTLQLALQSCTGDDCWVTYRRA